MQSEVNKSHSSLDESQVQRSHLSLQQQQQQPQPHEDASLNYQIRLGIHVALTSGQISRQFIGVPESRLDYSIYGNSLSNLGPMMENTHVGEFAICDDTMSLLCDPLQEIIKLKRSNAVDHTMDAVYHILTPQILSSLRMRMIQVPKRDGTLRIPGATSSADDSDIDLLGFMPKASDSIGVKLASKFVNQALVRKLFPSSRNRESIVTISPVNNSRFLFAAIRNKAHRFPNRCTS
jgi:hypothetical protein